MVDRQRLQTVLRRLPHTLVRHYDVNHVLYQLSDDVTDVLGVLGGGVSLLEDGTMRYGTASNERVARVERLQDRFDEGPCKLAATTGSPVVVDDLRRQCDRWPRFAPPAIERGLLAVLGIPMHIDGTTLGALNIYDDRARAWSDEELDTARLLADMATATIVMTDQLRSTELLASQLQHALDSRVVIEQAKGIVARARDVDVAVAFELLRRRARSTNRKLHDLATDIVEGTTEL